MKLPDFLEHVGLNRLRANMGAPLRSWTPDMDWRKLDMSALKALLDESFVELPWEDIQQSESGPLSVNGVTLLAYMKKQKLGMTYKFHVAGCHVYNQYHEKYVGTRQRSGEFEVDIVDPWGGNAIEKGVKKRLRVCKLCLLKLRYKGYKDHRYNSKIYNDFSLDEFFSLYPYTPITRPPLYTSDDFPENEYPADWQAISREVRERNRWFCQECGNDCSNFKKYLHVHHIDSRKDRNNRENLKSLCIYCHSLYHERLKNSPDYKGYINERNLQHSLRDRGFSD